MEGAPLSSSCVAARTGRHDRRAFHTTMHYHASLSRLWAVYITMHYTCIDLVYRVSLDRATEVRIGIYINSFYSISEQTMVGIPFTSPLLTIHHPHQYHQHKSSLHLVVFHIKTATCVVT